MALAADDLLRTPGSLGEPFRVIESLPGVTPGGLAAGAVCDPRRQPRQHRLLPGRRPPAGAVPLRARARRSSTRYFLEKLDFYPGGYPARYGRFVSGRGGRHHRRAAARSGARLGRRAPVRRRRHRRHALQRRAGARWRWPAATRTPACCSRCSRPTTPCSYWDYQARVDHSLGPGRLTVFAFGSGDDLGHKAVRRDRRRDRLPPAGRPLAGGGGAGPAAGAQLAGLRPVGGVAGPGGHAAHPHPHAQRRPARWAT